MTSDTPRNAGQRGEIERRGDAQLARRRRRRERQGPARRPRPPRRVRPRRASGTSEAARSPCPDHGDRRAAGADRPPRSRGCGFGLPCGGGISSEASPTEAASASSMRSSTSTMPWRTRWSTASSLHASSSSWSRAGPLRVDPKRAHAFEQRRERGSIVRVAPERAERLGHGDDRSCRSSPRSLSRTSRATGATSAWRMAHSDVLGEERLRDEREGSGLRAPRPPAAAARSAR